jgi:hypothetical protein
MKKLRHLKAFQITTFVAGRQKIRVLIETLTT